MTPPDDTSQKRASRLIFVCVANSARSQIAEALARVSAPEGWEIFSAGSNPGLMHPLAVEVMSEMDIDISDHRSKSLGDVPMDDADVVVTLCAEEVCPAIPDGTSHMHWPLLDPVTQGDTVRHQFDAFRTTRDDLKSRIDEFWKQRG